MKEIDEIQEAAFLLGVRYGFTEHFETATQEQLQKAREWWNSASSQRSLVSAERTRDHSKSPQKR